MFGPYKVLHNNEVGRFVVASRSLEAGEIVFSELPFVVGPKIDCPPVCLGCYAPVDGCSGGPRCAACQWPLCATCSKVETGHQAECSVFSSSKVRFLDVQDNTATCPQYDCITPLRTLLGSETQSDRWANEVAEMEAHAEERKQSPSWHVDKVNVAGFLRGPCKLTNRFSEDLIMHVCGILEVNAFEARTVMGYSVRCLYPKLAILSHSCTPNTTHAILPSQDYRVYVRTTTKVNKDDKLHSCYTYTMNRTIQRQRHVQETKYFQCKCERCRDPTELNTNMSSIRCSRCEHGYVLSENPLDFTSNWICKSCNQATSAVDIETRMQKFQFEVDSLDESFGGVKVREELFKKLQMFLHPQNALLISLSHSLIQLYGRAPGYQFNQMSADQLKRKIELCKDVLQVLDIIEPGLSRARALTMYELHTPLVILAKLNTKNNCDKSAKNNLEKALKEARDLLKGCCLVLSWEDPNSPEGIISMVAKQSLKIIEEQLGKT
ncbi:SET domain-containing protein SmydA-8 [Ctenocephalides felis]|uniref:SET domain-containing protein SmydA-8 n=1 Tax=Ctenocephalides felis TaxID=7515 RepID=UPI000E6E4161|nr:SET domain-containing protein SmydA-8 [Ctenocephalides felis]